MKQTLLITTMIAMVAALAGCGKTTNILGTDKASVTLKDLLASQQAYLNEKNWCGQQPNPGLIQGCENLAMVDWMNKSSKLLALTTSAEPWPNKDEAFFKSTIKANNAQYYPVTPESTKIIASVPANAIHAYSEEINWCGVQAAYKLSLAPIDNSISGTPMFDHSTLSQVSPTCKIVSNIGGLDMDSAIISK